MVTICGQPTSPRKEETRDENKVDGNFKIEAEHTSLIVFGTHMNQ
jgi:hypothetical protein